LINEGEDGSSPFGAEILDGAPLRIRTDQDQHAIDRVRKPALHRFENIQHGSPAAMDL
jgi:hypothetical protein